MTTNLIERFNQSVGDQLVSRLSGYLGEPTEHTKSAIQSSLPGLIGTLLKKMGTPTGASSLVAFLQEEQMNGNLLSNMSTLFTGGEATEGLLSQGDKVLDFIFGKNNPVQSNLVDYLSTRDGINRGASSTLLRLISPMMMGIIGRHANENDLEEEGLSKLLAEQKTYIQEIVPKGFFQEIGLHALEKSQPEEVQLEAAAEETDEVATPPKSSLLKKIGPWLLLGSLALGMLLAMRACGGRPDGINSMAVEAASDSTKTENALPDSKDDESKETTRTEVPPTIGSASLKSIHDHLYGFSGDDNSRYHLDEVFFRGQSSVLTAPSMRPLDHLAALLQAYDDKLVRIEGFAHVAGDTTASAQLGEDRAVAVKDALIELGVDSARLEASGFSTPASEQENELLARKRWVSIGIR